MTHNFLRLPDVLKKVGFKKTKIYKEVKAGNFPKPISIGNRSTAWLESEIHSWQEERIRSRPQPFTEMVSKAANDNLLLNYNNKPNTSKTISR